MKAGYLKEFVVDLRDRDTRQGAQQRGNPPLSPDKGIDNIITQLIRIIYFVIIIIFTYIL